MEIFYNSIDSKSDEIQGYFDSGDIRDYTIKVHALKSSCKLIGALETSNKAQLLENAGKSGDTDYIKEHHDDFISEYKSYKDVLKEIFKKDVSEETDAPDKPMADALLMESFYEGLLDAANAMDCEAVEEVLREMEGYAIPESDKEKFEALCEKADAFDYDGIVTILS